MTREKVIVEAMEDLLMKARFGEYKGINRAFLEPLFRKIIQWFEAHEKRMDKVESWGPDVVNVIDKMNQRIARIEQKAIFYGDHNGHP